MDAKGVTREAPKGRPGAPVRSAEGEHTTLWNLAERRFPGSEEGPNRHCESRRGNVDCKSPWTGVHLVTFVRRRWEGARTGPSTPRKLADGGLRSTPAGALLSSPRNPPRRRPMRR